MNESWAAIQSHSASAWISSFHFKLQYVNLKWQPQYPLIYTKWPPQQNYDLYRQLFQGSIMHPVRGQTLAFQIPPPQLQAKNSHGNVTLALTRGEEKGTWGSQCFNLKHSGYMRTLRTRSSVEGATWTQASSEWPASGSSGWSPSRWPLGRWSHGPGSHPGRHLWSLLPSPSRRAPTDKHHVVTQSSALIPIRKYSYQEY